MRFFLDGFASHKKSAAACRVFRPKKHLSGPTDMCIRTDSSQARALPGPQRRPAPFGKRCLRSESKTAARRQPFGHRRLRQHRTVARARPANARAARIVVGFTLIRTLDKSAGRARR